MPQLTDIEQLLWRRIAADVPHQFTRAGSVWKDVPLGFYYGDESITDIVAGDIAVQAAALDGLKLSNNILRMLQDDIGLKTITSDAINRIFVATSTPESLSGPSARK